MARYLEVELFQMMDEPASVTIRTTDGLLPTLEIVRDEEEGDGHVTIYRVLCDLDSGAVR